MIFTEKDKNYMSLAMDKARKGIKKGQTPFGACIVRHDKVLACEHNIVWNATDITAHAEITAIRAACKKIGSIDLSGSTIYSTCEPCPMCFSACHWAGISKIVFGASIKDAESFGFNELSISNKRMKSLGQSVMKVCPGCLKQENQELFRQWNNSDQRQAY